MLWRHSSRRRASRAADWMEMDYGLDGYGWSAHALTRTSPPLALSSAYLSKAYLSLKALCSEETRRETRPIGPHCTERRARA